MPNSYLLEVVVTTKSNQSGELHGSSNLSSLGYWFKEIETRLKGDAQMRGFKIDGISWGPADKIKLPYEENN
mgnify:CR=1 FL=1